eukprot:CAMPEP_0172426896 /NCGR_PEP_ID=MMETSP1064-20121228/39534_1 /TAXON_ID=202472 /ORGANISM="Aulacoseira subarctica , Strain CCAP 1002/5" /LENGTH=260 /DNA_ID=CAMNT_0013170765 /DNA_START=83 /DNA_END=865 /DNA_ORIENTATION=+
MRRVVVSPTKEISSGVWQRMSSTVASKELADDNKDEIIRYLTLNNLSDNPGAIKKKRRVGRGIGSSKGKTCGRGHKGQNSRSGGGVHPTFEGGQTPLFKRIPKRGFKNTVHATPMIPVNLGTLQDFVDMGRLSSDKLITMKDLVEAGFATMSSVKHGMKLLSKGKERLRSPLKLEMSRASASAIQALEAVGGQVTTVHFNKLALRALLKPHKFELMPNRARPPPKFMPYYTSYKHRGYLSLEMQLQKMNLQLSNLEIKEK